MSKPPVLSREDTAREILKCGKDPAYFTYNYAKISHPIRGLIPFHLFPFQETLIKDFNNYRFTAVLKARQLGVTWTTAAYAAWLMQYFKEKRILVIATKMETAAGFVRKVKTIIKHLPLWIRVANLTVDNRQSFELSNGSSIVASATSEDAGRSEALSLLIVDEAAFVNGLETLWNGLYSTLSTGGRCIMVSTPSGVGTFFHQTYVDAESGKNDFHAVKLPWDLHPERDAQWFTAETKNMSSRQIAQELLCSFSMSGESVISPEDLERLKLGIKEPKFRVGFDRNLWVWEEHKEGEHYCLCADVARGDGKDYSVFHICKLSSMEIVAEYQGKCEPDVFASLVNSAGREYGNALVVVENALSGYHVVMKLSDMRYPNLYYASKGSHEYIDPVMAENNGGAVSGFSTTNKTRPIIIAKLEEMIRNKVVTIYSKRMISELDTFVWSNGRPEALKNYNDDLIMAMAILCWVRDTALIANKQAEAYSRAFLGAMRRVTATMDTRIPGMIGHKQDKEYWKNHFRERMENEMGGTPAWGYIK